MSSYDISIHVINSQQIASMFIALVTSLAKEVMFLVALVS